MPRRWVHWLAALTAAALLLQTVDAGPATQEVRSEPFVGLTYIVRHDSRPRELRMHVVQVDLTAPGIRFALSPAAGTREVVRQTTTSFLAATGAQVAINAHFFWPWPTTDTDVDLVGIAAANGVVYSGFETPVQSYALVGDAPGLNIDQGNRASLVHRDPTSADGRGVIEPVKLWNTVSGSAEIVADGVVTIPSYRDAAAPRALLTPGGPNGYSNERSWYDVANARTAVGLSQDGRVLTLFTVDVRGGSAGMRVREVAEVLVRDYGVWNALNLDGGGSTSMAMADPATGTPALVNTSSGRPEGRAVGSSLAVFARGRAAARGQPGR